MVDESPQTEQPGTYRLLELQMGTLSWKKVDVPHTGNAVEGFCPRAVQGVWAQSFPAEIRMTSTGMRNFFSSIFSGMGYTAVKRFFPGPYYRLQVPGYPLKSSNKLANLSFSSLR